MTDLTDSVTGIVHEETQTEGPGLDLTLGAVHRVHEPAQVDFGGDELADADLVEEIPETRDSDDDYGWWDLSEGTYLIEHNESLDTDEALLLQIRDAVRVRGAFHPTLRVTDLDLVPLTTGGIEFKENARVSTLFER